MSFKKVPGVTVPVQNPTPGSSRTFVRENEMHQPALDEAIEVELDDLSDVSSNLGDFGDTESVEEMNSENLNLINIREKGSSSDEEEPELPTEEGAEDLPFPPTVLVLRIHPMIKAEALSWLVHKVTATKRHGGAELTMRSEPFTPISSGQGGRSSGPDNNGGINITLHLTATSIRFLEVAEFLELKKLDERGLLREFQVRDLDAFLHSELTLDSLITPAEKQLIVLNELENIQGLPGEPNIPGYPDITIHVGQSIFQVYVSNGLISSYYPLHDERQIKGLLRTNWFRGFWSPEPFEELRCYFGESVTLFFAFSAFYTSCLIPPAVIVLILTIIPEKILSKNMRICFVSLMNLIWVTILLKKWRRKCSELAYNWGTLRMTRWEEPRLNYRGRMSIDPITGRYQPKSPWWKTGLKVYCVSLPLVILCMFLAFQVMLIYFKTEKMLDPYKKTYEDHLVLGTLAEYAATILYAILVAIITLFYRQLADGLTEWENHRTQSQFDKHRVAKLVAFEFVNNFMSFIWIAFILQDMQMLKSQLLVMLIIQHLIVAFQEAILPLFIRTTSSKMKQFLVRHEATVATVATFGLLKKSKTMERKSLPYGGYGSNWIPSAFGLIPLDKNDPRIEMRKLEGKMVPYKGSFDDYLQLYIQFGYVFLFSPLLPWAVAIAAFTNVFLLTAGVFKLCQVFQRPIPKRVKDIGTWQSAFELMGILSVMTNCALITISSGLKSSKFSGWTNEEFYFFIIVCEHCIVGLKVAVSKMISDVPYWVKIATTRQEYRAKVAWKKEQHLKSRRRLSLRFQVINQMLQRSMESDESIGGDISSSSKSKYSMKTAIGGRSTKPPSSKGAPSSTSMKTAIGGNYKGGAKERKKSL